MNSVFDPYTINLKELKIYYFPYFFREAVVPFPKRMLLSILEATKIDALLTKKFVRNVFIQRPFFQN